MNKPTIAVLLIIQVILSMGLGIYVYQFFSDPKVIYDGYVEEFDRVSGISNKSNSMGLVVKAGDKAFLRYVKEDDELYKGSIYVYKKENYTVIHRLVECVDIDCNVTIFKGDNNERAEFVNRTDVVALVRMVEYG